MVRRCTTDACILKATGRTASHRLNLPVVRILRNASRDWERVSRGKVRVASERKLSVDWTKYTKEEYLFVHSSIVCSVQTAENGYWIDPACSELVNTNGNAWSTPVLMATFRTFIGKNNYVEHEQIPSLSKGMILDAVLRPVTYTGKNGQQAEILWCDILVATNRKHVDLCDRIERGELNTMSMGALAHKVQCSRCGKIIDDDTNNCTHIDNELMTFFVDPNGVERIVAELCGVSYKNADGELIGDPDSTEFVEASWVENPAFKGAVVNHFIYDQEVEKKVANILELPTHLLQNAVDDLFHMRVADRTGMTAIKVACKILRKTSRNNTIQRVAESFSS